MSDKQHWMFKSLRKKADRLQARVDVLEDAIRGFEYRNERVDFASLVSEVGGNEKD